MKESYRQKPLLTLAAGVAAMALLLAGCGGGSSSTTPTTPVEPTPPPPPPGPSAADLFVVAQDSRAAADAAVEDAGQAVKDAVKYAGMLTAQMVDGESAMAVANAEMVLAAEMAANNAVMAAEQAMKDVEEAKTTAMGLDDSATKTSLLAALDSAIEHAKSQIKAAKMARDVSPVQTDGTATTEVDSLKEAVAAVRGGDPSAPMMPAAHGKTVATSVKTALGTISYTLPDPVPTNANLMNNGSSIRAMTWAMIVGEANVMDVRWYNSATTSISQVKAMSVMGSMGSDLLATGQSLPADSDTAIPGIQNSDGLGFGASYKGIPGTVFCAGTDCGQSADGNLTGSWYFTPTDATELYVADQDTAGSYKAAAMFAVYGYWLTFTDGAASGIGTYAGVGNADTTTGTNTANLDLLRPDSASADVTARYSGKTGGISTRGDASGHFTATVNLTATFGEAITDSSLSGSITGFEGNATNPNWRVTLEETPLDAGANLNHGTAGDNGNAFGGAAPGVWTAQGYGPRPVDHDNDATTDAIRQRPAGFFGTFNANFHDGMAAGAYAAD